MLSAKIRRQLAALTKNAATFSTLSDADQLACRLVLRDTLTGDDRFATDTDRQLVYNAATAIPEPDVPRHEGAFISFHPTRRLCFVRFIERDQIDPAWRPHFLPVAEMPELVTAYVDPTEYHFRSTDDVLPLESHFEGEGLAASASHIRTLAPGAADAWQFTLEPSEALESALGGLDGLGLYVSPMHTDQRGGERLAFRSETLADVLDGVVRRVLPSFRQKRYTGVNTTFRLSRFVPGDAVRYAQHDAPFCDLSASQISRYTLLVYLTGGSASPVVSVEGASVRQMPALNAVLADQRLARSAAPFVEGPTVVLEAELVYTEQDLLVAPELVELFSRARSLTGDRPEMPAQGANTNNFTELLAAK